MDNLTFNPDTHQYFMDGRRIPGVSEILQRTGLIDLSYIRVDVLEAAKKFGLAVHKACELWDKNDLNIDILSPPLIPYLEAWKKFLKDYAVGIDLSCIEKIVYSERWKFAGTLDRIIFTKEKAMLVDIKSSTIMQPVVGLQLAAYKIAYEEMTKQKIRQRWGVQLQDDGKYRIEKYDNPSDESVFLAALQIYNWKKANLKGGNI